MAKADQAEKQATAETELAAGDLLTFAKEYDEDRKTMRWAMIVAVILHVIFFTFQFPEFVADAQEQKKPKIYVVQQVRFKPPPPKQQQEIPKPASSCGHRLSTDRLLHGNDDVRSYSRT